MDTATRVLSVRDLKTAEDSDASEDPGTSEDASGPAAGSKGSEGSGKNAEGADGAGDGEKAEETAGKPDAGGEAGEESAEDTPEAADASEDSGDDTADAGPDAGDGSAPEAKAGAKKAGAKKAGAKKADEESADERPEAEEPASASEPASESDSASEAEPPVDQPTAIFKAPKPPVDQPTAMLKLGGATKDGKAQPKGAGKTHPKGDGKTHPKGDGKTQPKGDGEAGSKVDGKKDAGAGDKKSTPESEVERTSTFVALKPLDDPATRRPQPKDTPGEQEPQPKGTPGKPARQPEDAAGEQAPKADAQATAAVPAAAPVGPERTTQQPLPPKPPLDLLAELTNTPPPPETPLRTTMRRVKIWTPLVVLVLIVFAIVQAVRPLPGPGLQLTAKEDYTFDGGKLALPWPDEGQGWMDVDGVGTMDHFGKQTPAAIGSVAKTMTAYIILKDHPLKPGEDGPKIKVDATAEKEGGFDKAGESTLNTVKAGDSLTEKQALSAVMIPSANNIARLLARWDAGSEAAFVKKMNATARALGMTGTTYTDPSGLKETTVSTAEDQVKLGNAVVKDSALIAITRAASWTDPSGHYWTNYNTLPFRMGAIGLKTGTTTAAGGNLLFAARKKVGGQTVTVVGAILGQHKGSSILDTANAVSRTALLGAENALTSEKILKKGDVVGYVDDRLGGHTPIVVTQDVTAVGWAGSVVKLSFAGGAVPHTAKAGTEVGTLTVGDGGAGGAIRVPVALQKDLAEPGFADKLTRLG